ncbi:MAG: ATP-binding cassette domain-containing protein [Bacteroidales bacterium]|nr:ATP-binding cassette domain-containing protein [Bacteroidales bacterium]
MSDIALKFENISKQYRLGNIGTGTLSNDLNRWWLMNIRGKEDPNLKVGEVNDRSVKANSDYIWALKNIHFEVKKGEVLGIIGKNGAGKSTLLKILSRVTTPTTGKIHVFGRIASLLEVGTGFHPEMTGRENIYMNGAIMGMTKNEITRKFDEIVDFSGVEKYIGTPVKRYSSGMTVRLGFAIAAHLEPEILVVDEVLAVGDAEFQKKAIGKMQDVSKSDGRTVLFVSHNMASVKTLCNNGILLKNGEIWKTGEIDPVVAAYLKGENETDNYKIWSEPTIFRNGFKLLEIGIKAKNKNFDDVMRVDDELEFFAKYVIDTSIDELHLTLHFKDEQGNKLFSTSGGRSGLNYSHSNGVYMQKAEIPANFFNWGNFSIDLFVVENRKEAVIIENDIICFTLANRQLEIGQWMGREPGGITPYLLWTKTKL